MKRSSILFALAACTKQGTPATLHDDSPTPLQIIVLDDYSSHETCDGFATKKIEVAIDGAAVGVVEIPCRTKTVMPPPQLAGPTTTLGPGTHRVVAREQGLGYSVEREIELPVITSSAEDGTDELATKLPVWASDDQLEITAPKVTIRFGTPE